MISHTQSGPYSWWESSSAPAPSSWVGTHPAGGQGSSPHAWGLAGADKVLLDSLVAQRTDGDLVVGRGIPPTWLRPGATISVTNFPTTDGHRAGVTIRSTTGSDHTGSTARPGRAGHVVLTFTFSGSTPTGAVLVELPSFVDNVARTSTGTVDEATGTVTVSSTTRRVTVVLRQPPSASRA